FVHGLRDLGWIEGRNIVIERRSAEGRPDRLPGILAELITRGVDVITVGGSLWLLQDAQKATQTIPTVAAFPEDSVATGLVRSFARPGGNLTGVTNTAGHELAGKRAQILKELSPNIARMAFLGPRQAWEAYQSQVEAAGVAVVFAEVDRPGQLGQA